MHRNREGMRKVEREALVSAFVYEVPKSSSPSLLSNIASLLSSQLSPPKAFSASYQIGSLLSSCSRSLPHVDVVGLKLSASLNFIVRASRELKLSIYGLATESAGDMTAL